MTDDTARDAERYVLGAMLLDARCIDDVTLTPAEHYEPRHESIHAAILAVHATGARPDLLTVSAQLERTGDLARVGGSAYLHDLQRNVPSAANADYYAGLVREAAAKRAVIAAGTRLVQQGNAPDVVAAELVEVARAELDAVADRIAAPGGDDLHAALTDAIDALEEGAVKSTPSPWPDLDKITGGWRPGAVYVIAGRPGTGKSVIGTQAAVHTALTGVSLVASCEMTRRELTYRALSALGAVDLSPARLVERKLSEHEWERVSRAQGRMADARLVIDDRSTVTVADIRTRARETSRRHGRLDLIVVDYLQLLTAPSLGRDASREQQVAAMSRGIKVMAGDLQVPVLLLAQLNRGPESRPDKRPRVADLRESGSLEQDADAVLLLHRDEEGAPDVLDIAVGKNRGGPVGAVSVNFEGAYSRVTQRAWSAAGAA